MMNYFKDGGGKVFAYDDDQVAQGFGSNMTAMSPAEVEAHLNPAPTYQSALTELNRIYQADIEGFKQAFSLAYLADGSSQDAKQAAIRAQYEARKALHATNIAALKAQYGMGV